MSRFTSHSLENEAQILLRLKITEQNLATILQKIDKEINQTDVEWMHLRSLVESSTPTQSTHEVNQPKPSCSEQRGKEQSQQSVTGEHNIDDQAVNQTHIDFSLGASGPHTYLDQEEEDSD